jgi:hypothetical protein
MKKVKDFIKKNPEPARPANVNPGQLGQYSAVNQVSESASLNQYLQSRGIDPDHLPTATKIAYAKSSLFLKWKRDHMNEDRTVTASPTQTKLNKLQSSQSAHKEIKTPKGPGVHSEASKVEDPAVKAWNKRYLLKQLLTYLGITEEKKPKPTALERFRKAAAERAAKHKEIEKKSGGMTAAIDRLQAHLNKEEVVNEMDKTQDAPGRDNDGPFNGPDRTAKPVKADKAKKDILKLLKKKMNNEEVENLEESPKEGAKLKFSGMYNPAPKGTFAYDQAQKVSPLLHSIHKKVDKERNKDLDKFIKGHKQGKLIPTEEDVGDPKAATQSPADGANGGNELSEKKRQMSKSARMIKALYKKKGIVKEDLFDGEKEDKSVKTYGKKPKFDKAEKDEGGENKPESAAVLTGGTTLTGTNRDEVEIDPLMRNRPGQPDVTKKDDKKKDDKKEDKKKDK